MVHLSVIQRTYTRQPQRFKRGKVIIKLEFLLQSSNSSGLITFLNLQGYIPVSSKANNKVFN